MKITNKLKRGKEDLTINELKEGYWGLTSDGELICGESSGDGIVRITKTGVYSYTGKRYIKGHDIVTPINVEIIITETVLSEIPIDLEAEVATLRDLVETSIGYHMDWRDNSSMKIQPEYNACLKPHIAACKEAIK